MFRSLTETTASAIFIYQEGKFRYVNKAMETLTGYTRQELLGMDFWDVVHPDDVELVRARGQTRLRGEDDLDRY